jgi:hypothetical protein
MKPVNATMVTRVMHRHFLHLPTVRYVDSYQTALHHVTRNAMIGSISKLFDVFCMCAYLNLKLRHLRGLIHPWTLNIKKCVTDQVRKCVQNINILRRSLYLVYLYRQPEELLGSCIRYQ